MENIKKGKRPLIKNFSNKKVLEYNVIDWFESDYSHDIDRNELKENKNIYNRNHNKEFTIFSFGVTEHGNSVCTKITGYNPYFYIRIPDKFTEQQINDFIDLFNEDEVDDLDNEMSKLNTSEEEKFSSLYYKSSIIFDKIEIVEKEIFWKFMNEKKFKLLKLVFKSKESMKFYYRYFQNSVKLNISGIKKKIKFNLFEADLEPLLRFFHDKKIKPSGWLKIKANKYKTMNNLSKCQINTFTSWENVNPVEKDIIAPLRVAAFDIEADSSHGDFPIARKDCKKMANQLAITWLRDIHTIKKEKKHSQKYKEATYRLDEKSEFFDKRIKKAVQYENNKFSDIDDDIDIIYLKGCHKKSYKDKMLHKCGGRKFTELCEEIYNICNHPIRKIKANMEMKAAINKVTEKESEYIESFGLPKINDLKKIIKKVAKSEDINSTLLQDKIITKDVMVRFINWELNSYFGHAYGDRVIQIGTVFWEYGDDECFHNNIITLRHCSDFKVSNEDCEVISYDYKSEDSADRAESKILIEWT